MGRFAMQSNNERELFIVAGGDSPKHKHQKTALGREKPGRLE
ncbi:MAG TPA: hypothetical protein VGN15_14765 [Ktedonobacteraceae bacterium]|nr:hypothetical protein [Ktedonobacteraceae bacterium]